MQKKVVILKLKKEKFYKNNSEKSLFKKRHLFKLFYSFNVNEGSYSPQQVAPPNRIYIKHSDNN